MDEIPDDRKLCYCYNRDYGEVRRCIERTGATRVEQVTAAIQAGAGCRSCRPEIEQLIESMRAKRSSASPGLLSRLWRKLQR